MPSSRSSVLIAVATSPYQVSLFLDPHLVKLQGRLEVQRFTNLNDPYVSDLGEGMAIHLPLTRSRVVNHHDFRALALLVKILYRKRPLVVETVSPKAGLIGQVAARLAGVPCRVHIFTGQVWADMPRGSVIRTLGRLADRAVARLATDLMADSQSQARFLKSEGLVPSGKEIVVPAGGSIRGVDLVRFKPDPAVRSAVRESLGIDPDGFVFLYLGRIAVSKGIVSLLRAFSTIRNDVAAMVARDVDMTLLCVGRDEAGLAAEIERVQGARYLGFSDAPETLLAASDVLVLPSAREGFGSTVIEAAATGIPAIATRIPGIVDAVEDGITGWLVPPGDSEKLAVAMATAAGSPRQVEEMGLAARSRAAELFEGGRVTSAYADHIVGLLEGVR